MMKNTAKNAVLISNTRGLRNMSVPNADIPFTRAAGVILMRNIFAPGKGTAVITFQKSLNNHSSPEDPRQV